MTIDHDRIAELERQRDELREALTAIEKYWGQPMPIGTSYFDLMRKWKSDTETLRAMARAALKGAA